MGCVFSSAGPGETSDKKMAQASIGTLLYACDICGQEGLTEDEMRTHVLIEHVEGSISCPFCDLEGITAEEMELHVNTQHLQPESLTPSMVNLEVNNVSVEIVDVETGASESTSLGNSGIVNGGWSAGSDDDDSSASPPLPMEITVTEVKDSPTSPAGSSDAGRDDAEQYRKRAKLYLHVPHPTPARQAGNNSSQTSSPGKSDCVSRRRKSNCDSLSNSGSSPMRSRTSSTTAAEGENDNDFNCPLCSWSTGSVSEITKHVNVEHLDALSPNKAATSSQTDRENNVVSSEDPSQPSTSVITFECPICGATTGTGEELEEHVNQTHTDILSPANSKVATPVSLHSFASSSAESPITVCPMCGMEFSDTNSLAGHVDGHFSAEQTPVTELHVSDNLLAQELERREREALKLHEQREFEKLQESYGFTTRGNYKKQAERNMEKAVYHGHMSISDFYARKFDMHQSNASGVDDGYSRTKDIIAKLKAYYKTSPPSVKYAWLSSPVDHYASSYGDKGWGCGYRNLQMMLACLSTSAMYEPVLFNGRPVLPSIPKIQRLIEAAWQKGFDVQGCQQLGGKLVNTTKWIGATEIVATLSSLRVKCQLCDFHAPTGKDGTHPRLFEWVRDYFRKDADFKPPLYLQHQGHSRTIVGIEELHDGSLRLLLFDPSCSRRQMQGFHKEINFNLMRSIRRTLNGMKAKQYQIVAVVGILGDSEYEESKLMKSDRMP